MVINIDFSTLKHYAMLLDENRNIEMAEELLKHASQMVVWQNSVRIHESDK